MEQKDVISYLGLPRGTFSNWVRKKSYSYYDHMDAIADFLGVSVRFLASGGDDFYIDKIMGSLTEEDLDFLKLYKDLQPEARRIVREMVTLVHG